MAELSHIRPSASVVCGRPLCQPSEGCSASGIRHPSYLLVLPHLDPCAGLHAGPPSTLLVCSALLERSRVTEGFRFFLASALPLW